MLFTFPSRYLSTIGLSGVLSLARWSWPLQAGFLVPRPTQGTAKLAINCVYGAITPSGWAFQAHSTSFWFVISRPYNPNDAETSMVWASPRSLATTWGVTIVFFSYGYLDVSVPRVRLPRLLGGYPVNGMGCPIRVPPGQWLFAPPQGLSQLITPFFASESQGILRTPLVTFFLRILVMILFYSLLVSSYFL